VTPTLVLACDAARLASIHAEAFDAPWSSADITEVLAGPGAFGLEIDPVGFILFRAIVDEAEVLTIAVRPAHQRRGVASTLLGGAIELATAQGARSMFLEVAEDNPAAQAFYLRHGFVEVGRRAGYYARPGGAVGARVLRRDLNR